MKTKNGKKIKDEISDHTSIQTDSLKKGLPSGWTRTTLVIRENQLEVLKTVAWWKRSTVKELVEKLVDDYVSSDEIKTIIAKINSLEREEN